MLKIAGWIISSAAVDDWRQAHAELNQTHPALMTPSRVLAILNECKYKGFKPLQFSEEQIISVSWPKVGTGSFLILRSTLTFIR